MNQSSINTSSIQALTPERRLELMFELLVVTIKNMSVIFDYDDVVGFASRVADRYNISYAHVYVLFRMVLDYNQANNTPANIQSLLQKNPAVKAILWRTACIILGIRNERVDVGCLKSNLDVGFSEISDAEKSKHLTSPITQGEMYEITRLIEDELNLPRQSVMGPEPLATC